jgi:hypothetical protein
MLAMKGQLSQFWACCAGEQLANPLRHAAAHGNAMLLSHISLVMLLCMAAGTTLEHCHHTAALPNAGGTLLGIHPASQTGHTCSKHRHYTSNLCTR